MEKPTMTVGEVATYLDCTEDWVYRNQQKIPGYFKIGGMVRFHRQTFLEGIKSLTIKTVKPVPGSDRHKLS